MPSETHTVTRVDVHTGVPHAQFVTALEKAAPPFDPGVFELIEEEGGSWDDVRDAMAAEAPHHLIRYWRINATPAIGAERQRAGATKIIMRDGPAGAGGATAAARPGPGAGSAG